MKDITPDIADLCRHLTRLRAGNPPPRQGRFVPPCLGRLEDRLAPGSVFGDTLAATIPAQIAAAPDAPPASTSLTLINLPPETAPAPAVDPGVTLSAHAGYASNAIAAVASTLTQPAYVPAAPAVMDELFASMAAPPPAQTPATPAVAPPASVTGPQSGNGGGSVSMMTSTPPPMPTPPPAPIPPTPPPVVPPPVGSLTPHAAPTAVPDAYATPNLGPLVVSAGAGVLSNDLGVPVPVTAVTDGTAGPGGPGGPGGPAPMTAVLDGATAHGSISLGADGGFTYTRNAGFTGVDSFTYHAVAGGMASNTVPVTLAYLGLPLALTNPGNQASAEGQVVGLALQATGTGGAITYAASGLPTGLGIDPATGLISGTVDYAAAENSGGVYATTVTATDANGSATQQFTWTVADTPRGPTLAAIPDQVNSAGDAVALPVSANDPDGKPLTFTATGLPGGLGIDPLTGGITGTIATSAYSLTPYQATVTASDGSLSASQYFTWTVSAIQLDNPGDQTNAIGDAVSLPLTVHDYSGGNPLFSASGLPNGLGVDPLTGFIRGTVAPGSVWQGSYFVTVSATDGISSTSQSFHWMERPAFGTVAPSIVNPGTQVNFAGGTVSLPIQASGPAGALTYSAVGLPYGLMISQSTGVISGTTAAWAIGTSTVIVAVVDPLGASASTTFTWLINDAPMTGQGIDVMENSNGTVTNQTLATFKALNSNDPAYYAATIQWGDNTSSAGVITGSNGQFQIQTTHTYSAMANYPVQVAIVNQILNAGLVLTLNALAPGAPAAAKPTVSTKPTTMGFVFASLKKVSAAGRAAQYAGYEKFTGINFSTAANQAKYSTATYIANSRPTGLNTLMKGGFISPISFVVNNGGAMPPAVPYTVVQHIDVTQSFYKPDGSLFFTNPLGSGNEAFNTEAKTGASLAPDVHAADLTVTDTNPLVVWTAIVTLGVGTYPGLNLMGGDIVPLAAGKLSDITWAGPTTIYTVQFRLNLNGDWSLVDQSANRKVAGDATGKVQGK